MCLYRSHFPVYLVFLSFLLLLGPNLGHCFNKWPDTDQPLCYDNENGFEPYGAMTACPANDAEAFYGQDAQYPMIQRNYTKLDVNGEELESEATQWVMVRDNVTGLIWEVKRDDDSIHDKDNTYTWCNSNAETNGGNAGTCGDQTDSEDFIATLNSTNFGNHNDWRLPTMRELSSLTNAGMARPSIDQTYFPQTVNDFTSYYWTSTSAAADNSGDTAWAVWFQIGNTYQNKTKSEAHYVRAVRGGENEPAVRFTDNGDGSITDNGTGLIWQKCSMGQEYDSDSNACTGQAGQYSWQQALYESEQLFLAENSDWRLPNRKEIQSLADYSRSAPATSFPGPTESNGYWSSSSNAWHGWRGWYLHFTHGNVFSEPKYHMNVPQTTADDLILGADDNPIPTMMYARAVRNYQSSSFYELQVNSSGSGSGTINSFPSEIDCPNNNCTGTFSFGTYVTLSATAGENSAFTGWSGNTDCLDGHITINENKNCTANFTATYTITAASTGSGTISPVGSLTFLEGQNQLFSITPEEHQHIADVLIDEVSIGAVNQYRFENINAAHTITAIFETDTDTLTITRSGSGYGNITSDPESIQCGNECSADFPYDTTITLTADPSGNSFFSGWQGDICSGTDPCTVTLLDTGINITAEFTRKPFPWPIFLPVIMNFHETSATQGKKIVPSEK